ncbi:hypothetical protein [Spirosoma utsteinense]|uniref:hypothetical protein n=1 Tax=Spirosoma utsteinense TaxID=2585773 RepID=UPI001648D201|nr:hypothetical protein [Spirosoma utsteinense]MBC3785715.1 hypothetical protein [Spirosoma utsteinense]
MSTTEAQRKIANMLAALKAEAPAIALRMGQTGLTAMKEDSIRDGITVDGSFANYTTNQVYKSSMKKKARNAAGGAYASSGGKGNWGEFRAAQGLKSDHVNLFYTGQMWSALRIIAQSQNGYRYSVLVGASNGDAGRLLIANIERYGNFLKLSDEKKRLIIADAAADVTDIVKRYL